MQSQMLGGRYQIIAQLGKGGFGVTFLALDMQRPGNPRCVVKQFKPMFTDPYTLQVGKRMFDQEAETLEKLGIHDQIPRLLAHFEENQEFYIVQEFIEGHDLSEELPLGQQQNEAFVIKLLYDTLEVLAFVHQNSAIHRDIKPTNIRRRQSDNKIVLIDFGAVKQISTQVINSQGQTRVSVPVGTHGYMPSEQANGTPRFSSDIYALGMIGIQALTGVSPISLPTDKQTSEIVWRDRVKVNSQFANILDMMVRYDFRQRYQSAESALQALTKLPSGLKKGLQVTGNSSSSQVSTPTPTSWSLLKKFFIGVPIAAVLVTGIVMSSQFFYQEKFLPYDNSSYGIKIKYPQTWEIQYINNPITGEVVAFLSPKQNDADKFQEKLTISVEDFSGTLDEFSNSLIKENSNHLTESKIINTSTRNLAYKQANQIIFTGKDGDNRLQNLQVFTLKDYKAYVITYTAEIDNYDDFIKTAQSVIDSFEFLQ